MLVARIAEMMQVYVLAGVVFSLAFVLRGAGRIDSAARDGSWGFRLLILPGAAALWPLLLWRWIAAARNAVSDSGDTDS